MSGESEGRVSTMITRFKLGVVYPLYSQTPIKNLSICPQLFTNCSMTQTPMTPIVIVYLLDNIKYMYKYTDMVLCTVVFLGRYF